MAIDASKLKRGNKLGAPPSDTNPQLAGGDQPPADKVKTSSGEEAKDRPGGEGATPPASVVVPPPAPPPAPVERPSPKEEPEAGKGRARKGDAWGMPRPHEPIAKLGIDLTPDVRRRFKAKAAGEGRDGADLIRDWIRQYLGE